MLTDSHSQSRHSQLSLRHLAAVLGLFCFAQTAGATHVYTIANGNSSVDLNVASQFGMSDWGVDGQDHLKQDCLWYRVGNDAEASIDTLGCPSIVQTDASTLQMTYGGNNFNIYTMTPEGKNPVKLTSDAGSNESPSWSPDGRHLVFMSTRTGSPEIFVMGADGSEPKRITFTGGNSMPSWSDY